jgi:DNA-directed RNA polymerase specialized sigma24 family protein
MVALAHVPSGGQSAKSREAELVSAVLRKDRKATAEFVSCCSDWIYPFVRRRLVPRTDMVEDLLQEILISAWQNLPNFRGEAGLRAWILGIARHKVEDHYRRRIREAELQEDDSQAVGPTLRTQMEEKLRAAADEERVEKHWPACPKPTDWRLFGDTATERVFAKWPN